MDVTKYVQMRIRSKTMENIAQLKNLAKGVSLLYVEDNDDLREAFAHYLKNFFDNLVICKDGQEGLEAYKTKQFDIVVTDIEMPRMNGLEMSQAIKLITPYQHILIISAYKDTSNYEKAIKIGIDGYVLKPIEFEQVNETLIKVCMHINSIKENEKYKNHLEDLLEQKTLEIKEQYVTDALTGLNNRIYLDEKLKDQKEHTIVLFNIDNFSIFNYNFGFGVGDEIIKETAKVLRKFMDDDFTLFRMQGDEFVFLTLGKKFEQAKELAEKVKAYFALNAVQLEKLKLHISFTIAIDAGEKNDLLRSASLAVQEIREIGKNHIGVYDKESGFEQLQKNNLMWIDKIKGCLQENRFTVYFQALKKIKTGEIKKYEALARLISPENEVISPFVFLKPLAMAGLLTEFTKQIIDKAFAFVQDKEIVISINITGEDFKEKYLVSYLEAKREEYGIKASSIILEILESVSIIDSDVVLTQLKELKALGYKIAIDDFGTENSNFSRLLTLKVDFIKIDGSFIKNITTDTNAQEIVKAIVLFAHNIGCEVIAEFVHNKEVYDLVAEYDIDFAQGYYISEPKPTLIEERG